jgi:hypothetical protein
MSRKFFQAFQPGPSSGEVDDSPFSLQQWDLDEAPDRPNEGAAGGQGADQARAMQLAVEAMSPASSMDKKWTNWIIFFLGKGQVSPGKVDLWVGISKKQTEAQAYAFFSDPWLVACDFELTCPINARMVDMFLQNKMDELKLHEFAQGATMSCAEGAQLSPGDASASSAPVPEVWEDQLPVQLQAAYNLARFYGIFFGDRVRDEIADFAQWLYSKASRDREVDARDFSHHFEVRMKALLLEAGNLVEKTFKHVQKQGAKFNEVDETKLLRAALELKLNPATVSAFGPGALKVLLEKSMSTQLAKMKESMRAKNSSSGGGSSGGGSSKKSTGGGQKATVAPTKKGDRTTKSMIPPKMMTQVLRVVGRHCLSNVAGGCSKGDGCRFDHKKAEYSDELHLASMHLGGVGGKVPEEKREDEARLLIKKLGEQGTRSSGPGPGRTPNGDVPNDIFVGARHSDKPDEVSLARAIEAETMHLELETDEVGRGRAHFEGLSLPDNAVMRDSRDILERVKQICPKIVDVPHESSAMVIARARVVQEAGTTKIEDMLEAGLVSLERSTLKGTSAAAKLLRGDSTNRRRGAGQAQELPGRGPPGQPDCVIQAEDREGVSQVSLYDRKYLAVDHGHIVEVEDELVPNQCVLAVLGDGIGVPAGRLRRKLADRFASLASEFGSEKALSELQRIALVCHHDFSCRGEGSSHDFQMVLVAEEFFRHHRVVVLSLVRDPSEQVASSVCIFESPHWNASTDKTVVAITSQGHALSLMQIGSDGKRAVFRNEEADAQINHWRRNGVEVRRIMSVTDEELRDEKKVMMVADMGCCYCGCGQKLEPPAAMRASGHHRKARSWDVGSQEIHDSMMRFYINGDGSTEQRQAIAQFRSDDYSEHCCLTQSDLQKMTVTSAEEASAAAVLAFSQEALTSLNRELLKEGSPLELNKAKKAVRVLAGLGDKLVKDAKSSRRAAALLRRAFMAQYGRLSTCPVAVEKLAKFFTQAELSVLMEVSDRGSTYNEYFHYDLNQEPVRNKHEEPSTFGDTWFSAVSGTAEGNCFLFTTAVLEYVVEPVFCTRMAVPKKDEMGRPSGKFRDVVDGSRFSKYLAALEAEAGLFGIDFAIPKMNVGFMKDFAYNLYLMTSRWPGLRVMLMLADEDGAFKRVLANLGDVNANLYLLPAQENEDGVVCCNMSAPMGYGSSPAVHDILSTGVNNVVRRVQPPSEDSAISGGTTAASTSEHFVDDLAIMVMELGSLPEFVSLVARKATEELLGPHSWNQKKNEFQAQPGTVKKQWGFLIDVQDVAEGGFAAARLSVPEVKLMKALTLLREMADKLGRKHLLLKEVSAVAGLCNWMSIACEGMEYLMTYFYAMMASSDDTIVKLTGPQWLQDQAYRSFAKALHLAIMLVLSYKDLGNNMVVSLVSSLSEEQLLSLNLTSYWLSFDACGGPNAGYGFVDYFSKLYGAGLVEGLSVLFDNVVAPVDRAVGYEGETIIAIGEIIAFMVGFMSLLSRLPPSNGELRLIKVITDNQVVWRSVMKRGSRNPQIQWMLSLLARLSLVHRVKVIMHWTWTKHNVLSDLLSRCAAMKEELLQAEVDKIEPGLSRDENGDFAEVLSCGGSACDFSLEIPGDSDCPEIEAELRRFRGQISLMKIFDSGAQDGAGCRWADINGGLPCAIEVGESLGMACVLMVEKSEKLRNVAEVVCAARRGTGMKMMSSLQEVMKKPVDQLDMVFLHCLDPAQQHELRRVLEELGSYLRQSEAKVVVVEFFPDHWKQQAGDWIRSMQEFGYQLCGEEAPALEDGPTPADGKVRSFAHFEKDGWSSDEPLMPLIGRATRPPPNVKDLVDPPVGQEGMVEGEFRLHRYKRQSGRAEVVGFLRISGDATEAARGWFVSLEANGPLMEVIAQTRKRLQVVEPGESRSTAQWVARAELKKVLRPAVTVTSIDGPSMPITGRSGVPLLVEETRGPGGSYFRQLRPAEVMSLHSGGDGRVKAVLKEAEDKGLEAAVGWNTPISAAEAVLARARARIELSRLPLRPDGETRGSGGTKWKNQLGGPGEQRSDLSWSELEDAASKAVTGGLAAGTLSVYRNGLNHWEAFCTRFELPLLLKEDRDTNEKILLVFMSWLRLKKGLAAASITSARSAVRMLHICNGRENPFKDCERATLALKSYKKEERLQCTKKMPVTSTMLQAILAELNLAVWDDLVLMSALMVGFVFLLRSGEMVRGGAAPDGEKCLKMKNVRFLRKGKEVRGEEVQQATEVLITVASSKTDQAGNGVSLTAKLCSDPLCPGRLLQRMWSVHPNLGDEGERFMFTLSNGKVIHRDALAKALDMQGVAAGLPPKSISVHSLRSGGASAMWAQGYSAEYIKTRGRWKSECWREYVWGGQDQDGKLVGRMLKRRDPILAHVVKVSK